MNSLRVVYLDRPHSDPDVVVRSHNGESIGRWEGDTLVIDTQFFIGHHHWIDSGIPASDAMHVVERVKMVNEGKTLEIEYAIRDPEDFRGRVEVDQAVEPRGRPRHRGGLVLSRSQRPHAEHALEGKRPMTSTRSWLASLCAAVLLAGGAAVRPPLGRRHRSHPEQDRHRRREGVPVGQPARVDRSRRAQRQGRRGHVVDRDDVAHVPAARRLEVQHHQGRRQGQRDACGRSATARRAGCSSR